MANIHEVDKNFKIETEIRRENLRFWDSENAPFKIYGLKREGKRFCRIPGNLAKSISDDMYMLHTHTAGGRVRFVTDSSYIAISAKMDGIGKMPHFALTGSAGFDLYKDEGCGQIYHGTFVPPFDMETGYESVLEFTDCTERVITINFPLYSNVQKLYIGLEEGAVLKPAPEYRYEKPIVYYGSSITQGRCASRPGNAYQAIISRLLDGNFINLGFSGNAKGEDAMAEYISSLEMSVFVMDYDYNAPTVEHLENTHERMFKKIREKHPKMPIVMLTRPKVHLTDEEKDRMAVVENTFQKTVKAGDKQVHFIKGSDLIASNLIENATVDNVHPNDSGFVSMAYALYKVLSAVIC